MIRLKCGVYGAEDGMKRPKDGPFSLTDNEEARLVSRGVAEYVFDRLVPPIQSAHTEGEKVLHYDVGMTMKQLQGIAAYFGLDASKLKRKQAVVDMLDAHLAAEGAPGEPPEEDLDLGGEEPPEEDTGDDEEEGEEETGEVDPDAPDLGAAEPTV